jgi:hypothetical protein
MVGPRFTDMVLEHVRVDTCALLDTPSLPPHWLTCAAPRCIIDGEMLIYDEATDRIGLFGHMRTVLRDASDRRSLFCARGPHAAAVCLLSDGVRVGGRRGV